MPEWNPPARSSVKGQMSTGRRVGLDVKKILLLCVCLLIGACSSTSHRATRSDRGTTAPTVLATGTSTAPLTMFASTRIAPDGHVLVAWSGARTGAAIATLLSVRPRPTDVSGIALTQSGEVWVTLNSGPTCSSDVNGCGPKAHS